MLTGLLEVTTLLARHAFFDPTALRALQMNRHFLWITPLTDLGLFLTCGIPLAVLAAFRPAWARRVSSFGFTFLTGFSLLLIFQGLYMIASVGLALGLASRIAPRLGVGGRRFQGVVRLSSPVFAVIVLVLMAFSYQTIEKGGADALSPSASPTSNRKNVIMVIMDTVRADHLSLYGYPRETTPNLSRLAQRGTLFNEARSAAPWTFPSHSSMFTGRWPHELNIGSDRPLDTTYPTLAEFLSRNGYATAGFVGNTYFCNTWTGLGRGFAHYEDSYEHDLAISPGEALRCSSLGRLIRVTGGTYKVRPGRADRIKDAERVNDRFLGWLSKRDEKRPFFAFLNYIDAHDPYQTPAHFGRNFGLKPESAADHETIRAWFRQDKKVTSPHELTLIKDAYDDCIAYLDEQIGVLFNELDKRGVLKETVVVIAADHGEGFGEHGVYLHGKSLYRHEVHVPLMVIDPSSPAKGSVVAEPVSLRDLAATIVDRV
ncbi:sulfatase, partial [Singulisphaera rosea]